MAVDIDSKWIAFDWALAGRPIYSAVMFAAYRPPGAGYLAGEYPDGLTTVDGVPVAATVRAIIRSSMPAVDGVVVAEVQSSPDGTWRIDGLDPALKYDVVARTEGHNDVIVSGVSPAID